MADAITKADDQIKKSEQNIFNKSYDEDFNIVAIEILGYDSNSDVLRRILVNSDGELKVAL